MEKGKRDLEALVSSQKEQLIRYEKRLKDVVTAYKGLLKEKEALETSLVAVTASQEAQLCKAEKNGSKVELSADICTNKDATASDDGKTPLTPAVNEPTMTTANDVSNDENSNLQTQIITLMTSLATLSAEKSRMEASFQADKKQLRALLAEKDQIIDELKAQKQETDARAKEDLNEMKAKWIIERQDREKESNNQMIMIRELQKLYADERQLKESIEMQLNNFKIQFANDEAENTRLQELQTQLTQAQTQLKQMNQNITADTIADQQKNTVTATESAAVLQQVQQEMQQLKEQHAIAIKNEQRRVLLAEEQSKRQAALHEDRVANLEARLAELSNTVGSYDRLRQQDQHSIQALKKKLQELEHQSVGTDNIEPKQRLQRQRNLPTPDNIAALVDEIMRMKKLLITENARAAHPIDVSKVFAIVGADHLQCQEELNRLQKLCEEVKFENSQLQEKLQVQKSHIATLQEKVKVLNRNIDEQELDLKLQHEKLQLTLKEERNKWKDKIAEIENECRCKISNLEQHLQKQRQRSLQLLDEKEQEIKTLQTSIEVFHSNPAASNTLVAYDGNDLGNTATAEYSSDADSVEGCSGSAATVGAQQNKTLMKPKRLSVGDNCHMLHYVNELARKDIEITALRKAKYTAETSLRKAIHEKVTAQEELCDKIDVLEQQVDRLERCKTREGANLEYLKNVIISFIVTKDADGKRHMMNAISAVLQFTPTEIQSINAAFHKK